LREVGEIPLVASLRQRPILLGSLLVLGTLLLYGRVAHDQFLVFDDNPYVVKNVHVSTGLDFGNVVWAFTNFWEANWHPLTWISHMADCQVFGLNSGPHHLVNLALHAINILVLFWLLRKATGAVWRSCFVAALFAVHPLNVETVAWVAQRKSLLSTLFSLLAIGAYGWYSRRPNWKRYLVVAAIFALALLSKPMAVSLPFVLLLLDYWPLERYADISFRLRWMRLSLEKIPLLLMSVASSIVTVVAQRSGGALADSSALPLSLRTGNALVSYLTYIGKTVWPVKLSVFYPHPERSLAWSDVAAAALLLVAITGLTLYFRWARYLAAGWLIFVVTLIPVIGIVQVGRQAMADRYAYVPCIGLFIIVAWVLCDFAYAAGIPRAVAALIALGMVMALAGATARYLPYWENGVKLLQHAALVAGRPDPGIEEALADALVSAGRYDEAYRHYGETCVLLPGDAFCHYNMAEILFNRHQLRDALEQYQLALSLTDRPDIELSCLINSAEILLDLGDYQTAQMRLSAALRMDPNNRAALQLRERAFRRQ
jgi:protein O-mannosyl-transferase